MKRLLRGTLLASTLLLVSCASTTPNLQRETARAVGGNIAPEAVAVSNVQRGMTSVKWQGDTPQGHYDCSADDMVRRVYCVRR